MRTTNFGSVGCFIIVAVLAINILLGGLCTEYVVEFWGSQIKSVPVDIPFLPCAIAGLFVGQFTIPAAVVTWMLSFVL